MLMLQGDGVSGVGGVFMMCSCNTNKNCGTWQLSDDTSKWDQKGLKIMVTNGQRQCPCTNEKLHGAEKQKKERKCDGKNN